MNRSAFVVTLILAGLLAGCSSRPTVQATYVPYEKFASLNCAQLSIALDRAHARADAADGGADSEEKPDAARALANGISKLRGEQAARASAARGDIDAISIAQIRNRCRGF